MEGLLHYKAHSFGYLVETFSKRQSLVRLALLLLGSAAIPRASRCCCNTGVAVAIADLIDRAFDGNESVPDGTERSLEVVPS